MRFVIRPLILLLVTVCLTYAPVAYAEGSLAPRARALVEDLGRETIDVLSDTSLSRLSQTEKMRRIFKKYFAVEEIGQFVLSRYWRDATPAERKEYLQLFEDLIVYGYASRFTGYAGEQLEILGERAKSGNVAVVETAVVASGAGRRISVDWEVEDLAASGGRGDLKIVDVSVEGVSLKVTQRSDFTGAIRQRGGKVSGLLEALRAKTKDLREEVLRS